MGFKDFDRFDPVAPVSVFPPERRTEWIDDLRAYAAELVATGGVGAPLRTMTAVGVWSEGDMVESDDYERIRESIRLCAQIGQPVSSDFTLTMLNLDVNGNGDFLKAQHPADLVVVCKVYNSDGWGDYRYDPELRQSPHYDAPGAWRDAAVAVGARVVIPFGGLSEINADHFATATDGDAAFVACEGPALCADPQEQPYLRKRKVLTRRSPEVMTPA